MRWPQALAFGAVWWPTGIGRCLLAVGPCMGAKTLSSIRVSRIIAIDGITLPTCDLANALSKRVFMYAYLRASIRLRQMAVCHHALQTHVKSFHDSQV